MDLNSVPQDRQWAGQVRFLGGSSSSGVWKMAIGEYYWDRLEHAYGLAVGLGVVFPWQEWFYRLIEAEAVTRRASETVVVDPCVSLEHIPSELHHVAQVTSDVAQATGDVRRRFGWKEGAKTLVSVLAEATNAPWTVGRAGYMMDKYPYDKICVPLGSTHLSAEFQSVIRHEYAHVMVLNLSAGKATTYLHESVTMVAQDWARGDDWEKFARGAEPWLEPQALTNAFDDGHDPARFHTRSLAYSQSSALGFYLKFIGGEEKIGDLLRAFGEIGNWSELKMRITHQTDADDALRRVYGFGEKELFASALEWLKRGQVP